jgi:hyperosmotically inducible periplasmic protein
MEVDMNTPDRILLAIASFALSVAIAPIARAQQSADTPASQQMKAAGDEMKSAGQDTTEAAKDVYHGTSRALSDTKITAKVKAALKSDDAVAKDEIHVKTVAGVVTLKGKVANQSDADKAAEIARQTEGVKDVVVQLNIMTASQ